MSLHRVNYEYFIREGATFNMDIDPALDPDEKEMLVLAEIKDQLDGEEYTNIDITDMKELN